MQDNLINYGKTNEIVIDFRKLFSDLLKGAVRYCVPILAVMLAFGGIGYYYSNKSYRPVYSVYKTFTVNPANSVIYKYGNNRNSAINKIGLMIPSILTSDVMKDVISQDLGYSSSEKFPASITAARVNDTNMIKLSVTSNDPQTADDIIESIVSNYSLISNKAVGTIELTVVDESGFPSAPSNTQAGKKKAALFMALGLFLSMAVLAIRSITRKTIFSEEQLTRTFNTEYFGHIPRVVTGNRMRKADIRISIDSQGIPPAFIESVKAIRHRTEREAQKYGAGTIMVTSAVQGEGKTTTACNLALALSNHKHKVLLIDGDLRNPAVPDALGIEKKPAGLTDYLAGKCKLEEILTPYEGRNNLTILPGGESSEEPSILWSSKAAEELFRDIRESYDYVIVDAPQSAENSEILLLTRMTDAALFIVRQNYAKFDDICEGVETFEQSGCRILGCVMT